MWLEKFLDIISRLFPSNPISGIEEALAKLDPQKIYVENVRSVLGVSYERAVKICETAVQQGFFKRGVEVLCPDDRVAASADTETNLPPVVTCWLEEDGHYEPKEMLTVNLRKMIYYQLNEQEAAKIYRTTA